MNFCCGELSFSLNETNIVIAIYFFLFLNFTFSKRGKMHLKFYSTCDGSEGKKPRRYEVPLKRYDFKPKHECEKMKYKFCNSRGG